MFADGGFFAELMMLNPPGHLDGRHGEWMTPPERFEELARGFWNAGLKIHVHVSGDLGVDLVLRTLERLQWERPRFDHRFTFEHFGTSTPQQVTRMAALGAIASCCMKLKSLEVARGKKSIEVQIVLRLYLESGRS